MPIILGWVPVSALSSRNDGCSSIPGGSHDRAKGRQTLGTASTTFEVPPGGVVTDLDAFTQPSRLAGRVFLDSKASGVFDPSSDEGLEGVKVELTNGNDLRYTVTTDDDGYYEKELLYGEWTVTILTSTLPPGLVQTLGSTATAVFVPGTSRGGPTFSSTEVSGLVTHGGVRTTMDTVVLTWIKEPVYVSRASAGRSRVSRVLPAVESCLYIAK